MKLIFTSHCIPQMDVSGAQVQTWALINQMIERGFEVTFIYLQRYKHIVSDEDQIKKFSKDFPSVKTIVSHVKSNPNFFQKLLMTDYYLMPEFGLSKEIEKIVLDLKPDLIFNYHYNAAAALIKLKDIPQITLTGDLLHSPTEARLFMQDYNTGHASFLNKVEILRGNFAIYRYKKISKKILKISKLCGSFGLSDAQTLTKMGVKNSYHFCAPVQDTFNPELRKKYQNNPKVRLLIGLGHLQSSSTYASLKTVVNDILPYVNKRITEPYEVHLIGQGFLQKDIEHVKKMKNVKVRGYVDDIETEYHKADIILLPTNVFIGFRTRIIQSFCHQVCTITHFFDTINMPEIINGKNAIFDKDVTEIAEGVIRAIKDKNYREMIALGGRKTYEEYYSPESACKPLLDKCEQISGAIKE